MYDYIIFVSGFSGSVALRLAEKACRVAVFEKGKRFLPKDLPLNNWNLIKSLWMNQLGLYVIWALSLLINAVIQHCTGVDRGSLNYASRLLVCPMRYSKSHSGTRVTGNPDWRLSKLRSSRWEEKSTIS